MEGRPRSKGFVQFARIYFAESCLFVGRYREATRALNAADRSLDQMGGVLPRMILCRRMLLASLKGSPRALSRAAAKLDALPRSPIELLEAWNDLFQAGARLLSGDRDEIERVLDLAAGAERGFRRFEVPAGAHFALLLQLGCAIGGSWSTTASSRNRS